MEVQKIFNNKNVAFLFAIIMGTLVGLASVQLCIFFDLSIYGFNIFIIVSPIIAGFVETFISKILTKQTSGAISSIILFIVTNMIGWLFPANPITWNIFTLSGFVLMLQAAFPLTINYLLITIVFLFVYLLGRLGSALETIFIKHRKTTPIKDMEEFESLDILILTNQPDIHIMEYKGLIFSEKVIEFEEKKADEIIEYMGSDLDKRNTLRHYDYTIAKEYMLNDLKKVALKRGANAIIDIEIEYTNFNQHFPPDVLISIYGTAVKLEEKYIN